MLAAAPDNMEEEEEIDLLVNVDEQEEMDTTDDEVGKIDSLAVDYATRHNMIASEVPRSWLYSCLASFFSSTCLVLSRVPARLVLAYMLELVLTLLCRAGSGHSATKP